MMSLMNSRGVGGGTKGEEKSELTFPCCGVHRQIEESRTDIELTCQKEIFQGD